MQESFLEIRNIKKLFGDVVALNDVSLSVEEGCFMTLLGPSGCGKTTMLRCIAGTEIPDQGEIVLGGRVLLSVSKGIFLSPDKRKISMVFQSYALWPHMTLFQNIAYPLVISRISKSEISTRVQETIDMLGLSGLEGRYPAELSGGQQQRVALARAIVPDVNLILLDEPLSNLDAPLRVASRAELKKLQRKLGVTMVYVTHSQTEALSLSHSVSVMEAGSIVQTGSPKEVYHWPSNTFVAGFLGTADFHEGLIVETNSNLITVEVNPDFRISFISDGSNTQKIGERITLATRPEDIFITENHRRNELNVWRATLDDYMFLGDSLSCELSIGRVSFRIKADKRYPVEETENLWISILPEHVMPL